MMRRDEKGVGEIGSRTGKLGIGHDIVTRQCHADISRAPWTTRGIYLLVRHTKAATDMRKSPTLSITQKSFREE